MSSTNDLLIRRLLMALYINSTLSKVKHSKLDFSVYSIRVSLKQLVLYQFLTNDMLAGMVYFGRLEAKAYPGTTCRPLSYIFYRNEILDGCIQDLTARP